MLIVILLLFVALQWFAALFSFFRHDKRNSGCYCRVLPGYSREKPLHTPLCHCKCLFDAFLLCLLTQRVVDSLVQSWLERVAQAHWWKKVLSMWPRHEVRYLYSLSTSKSIFQSSSLRPRNVWRWFWRQASCCWHAGVAWPGHEKSKASTPQLFRVHRVWGGT